MDQILKTPKPTWIPISCVTSISSYSHISLPFKNYIITFGGYDDSTILNQTFALDMDTFQCETVNVTGTQPKARHAHSASVWDNDGAIIFGGKAKGGSLLNETLRMDFSFSPLSVEYKTLKTKNAESLHRMWHTANICEGNLYVFGGKSKQQETTNELWKLDLILETLIWEKCQTTGYVPEERYSHSSVVCNQKIYYFGGYSCKYKRNLVDLFCLDIREMTFTQLPDGTTCPECRRGMSLVANNEKLYIFGGKQDDDNYFNDIYSYDLSDNLGWLKIETKNRAPPARGWQTCTPYKSGFVVWGGAFRKTIFFDLFYLQFDSKKGKKEKKEVRASNLLSQLKRMYTDKLFCDISFEVERQRFHAHKGILAAQSTFFANMFNSGMQESQADLIPMPPDIKFNIFDAFLKFIYGNELGTEPEVMFGLFELAEKWLVSDLKGQCEQYFSQNISQINLIKIATLAELYDNEVLNDQVMKFMAKNFADLEDTNILEELPKSIFIKFTTSKMKNLL